MPTKLEKERWQKKERRKNEEEAKYLIFDFQGPVRLPNLKLSLGSSMVALSFFVIIEI